MIVNDDGTHLRTVVFTEAEGEKILQNLERVRAWVESPSFQPNHHMPMYESELALMRALIETD